MPQLVSLLERKDITSLMKERAAEVSFHIHRLPIHVHPDHVADACILAQGPFQRHAPNTSLSAAARRHCVRFLLVLACIILYSNGAVPFLGPLLNTVSALHALSPEVFALPSSAPALSKAQALQHVQQGSWLQPRTTGMTSFLVVLFRSMSFKHVRHTVG